MENNIQNKEQPVSNMIDNTEDEINLVEIIQKPKETKEYLR